MSSNSSKNGTKLSYEQLRDVRDQLKRPLTGRTVLIPFGSKAFFPGKLQPNMRDDNHHQGRDGTDEMVFLTQQSGTQQEMSRSKALDKLQEEMDEMVQSKGKKTPLKSALKQSSSWASQKGAGLPKNALAENTSDKEATSNVFPYFEIREELDNSGNEIRSEAVNVSKHLEYLRSNTDVAKSELVPPVNQTTLPQESGVLEEIPVEDDVIPKKKLSDAEFGELSARLEELVRLEEESESQKTVNVASSKKLQSSSWSKGFLNKPSKKKSMHTSESSVEKKLGRGVAQAPANASTKPIESTVFTGVVKERSNKGSLPQQTMIKKLKSSPQNSKEESKVRFQEEPQVHEIPRIGQTPTGLLKTCVPGQAVQRTAPVISNKIAIPKKTEDAPSKKLSRFAMERQKLR